MGRNRTTFERLLSTGEIRIRAAGLFRSTPPPLPSDFHFSRIEGMMLGLAIGDALGNSSEGMWPAKRRASLGEVRNYPRHPYWGECRGFPSDDTQLAFWTLERMLEDGGFEPSRVAERFTQGQVMGIGQTVLQCLLNHRAGKPWHQCGVRSAGNGSLMRIAPILIPHLHEPSSDLWVDAALCSMITHNDSAAIASCVAFVRALWELLGMRHTPPPEWWLEMFVTTMGDLEIDELYEPRAPQLQGYRGPLWRLLEQEAGAAYRRGISVVQACERWHSGAYLLETVPSVLYILMRHGQEPEEAIVRAVNDTADNDTAGAIVGAAVGALHGRAALPQRWVEGLSGRTTTDDDGRVFELLAQAEPRWSRPTT